MVCPFFYTYSLAADRAIEFAEYTSAQERIPLGKKSKKVAASKRKETMQEMIADACVLCSHLDLPIRC